MSSPDEALRKVIAEAIADRLTGHADYLACPPPDALPVGRSELLYLWDEYGTEYLDWATLGHPVGHDHPLVRAAVADQLMHYGHTAPAGRHIQRWPVEFARELSGHFSPPGSPARRVLWTEGEREAVQVALRLSGPLDREVAVLPTGWHDWLNGFSLRTWPDPGAVPWGALRALLLTTVDAALRPLPTDELRSWVLAAREGGVPVIVDETVTGFGRTGACWGQERTGLIADVTVLGGAVGGGFGLGAVIAAPDFFPDRVDVSPQAGNPVACAAGQATLTAVATGVLEYLAETVPLFSTALDTLVAQFPRFLGGHHGEGMMRGLQFHDPARARRMSVDSRRHGLHLAPARDDVVLLVPALISSTNEISRGVDLLSAVLMEWEDEPRSGI